MGRGSDGQKIGLGENTKNILLVVILFYVKCTLTAKELTNPNVYDRYICIKIRECWDIYYIIYIGSKMNIKPILPP